jgi:hypothetical protein
MSGQKSPTRCSTDLGRPIPPLGLRHLEAGNRRIDVDDLVVLADALDVSPLMLLLPGDVAAAETQAMLLLLLGGQPGARRVLAKEALTDGND